MRDRHGERSQRLRRHCAVADSTRTDDRGQLSLTVVEAVVATLFVLAVAAGFALAPSAPTAKSDAPVRQATDTASLIGSVPAGGPEMPLSVAYGPPTEFDDRAARLYEVTATGLLNGALVSFRTRIGSIGRPSPEAARVRTAAAVVPRCTTTLEVQYP